MTEKTRTKRRYAHELYPHNPEPYDARPLAVEVPYLYSRAIGLEVWGTSWSGVEPRMSVNRTEALVTARNLAFLADAMLQGLTGQEAWDWADMRAGDETGELAHERAVHYGLNPQAIKPYPCGPEPTTHGHLSEPDVRGWQNVTTVQGKESECPECTEPVEERNA
ncbi:hypothetical protein [Glutamicibacter sp. NPDC087344]|uniref:hypothetical protein n=1 Tax=Glutamicibacter sp. NPDC087344 TaxID=3363994 RepID=UPI0037F51C07